MFLPSNIQLQWFTFINSFETVEQGSSRIKITNQATDKQFWVWNNPQFYATSPSLKLRLLTIGTRRKASNHKNEKGLNKHKNWIVCIKTALIDWFNVSITIKVLLLVPDECRQMDSIVLKIVIKN